MALIPIWQRRDDRQVSVRAREARVWLALAVVVSLAGCGEHEANDVPDDPYSAEYEAAILGASSEFVRSVLADHQVTDEELLESQDSLVACLRDSGFEPTVTSDGGRRTVNVPADADPSCIDEWTGPIEDLYWAERVNPENENMFDLVAACLARLDLVPDGFTGADLEELDAQAIGSYTVTQDGEKINEVLPQNENPTLPSGMPIRAQETVACWTSPLTTGLG